MEGIRRIEQGEPLLGEALHLNSAAAAALARWQSACMSASCCCWWSR